MTVIEIERLQQENKDLKALICRAYEKAAGELSWCGPLAMTPDWAVPGLERVVDAMIEDRKRLTGARRDDIAPMYQSKLKPYGQ